MRPGERTGAGREVLRRPSRPRARVARLHALDRHEARAEALDARLVGVAPLWSTLRSAQVSLLAAARCSSTAHPVAAAFAHGVVDEHAPRGLRNSPFLRRRVLAAHTWS